MIEHLHRGQGTEAWVLRNSVMQNLQIEYSRLNKQSYFKSDRVELAKWYVWKSCENCQLRLTNNKDENFRHEIQVYSLSKIERSIVKITDIFLTRLAK